MCPRQTNTAVTRMRARNKRAFLSSKKCFSSCTSARVQPYTHIKHCSKPTSFNWRWVMKPTQSPHRCRLHLLWVRNGGNSTNITVVLRRVGLCWVNESKGTRWCLKAVIENNVVFQQEQRGSDLYLSKIPRRSILIVDGYVGHVRFRKGNCISFLCTDKKQG